MDENGHHRLSVRNLGVSYPDGTRALDGIDLEIAPGEVVGLIGESGSGKSTVALSLLGLAEGDVSGTAAIGGRQVALADRRQVAKWRWTQISLAFQHAQAGMNPVHRVVDQIAEPLLVHSGARGPAALHRATQLWAEVGLPESRRDAYPHELSGGEIRRAMLAMALACEPRILIADEPTAGLDTLRRRQLLDLLRRQRDNGTGLLLISHDLADLDALADRVLVLHAGRVVESGPAPLVLDDPRHPYSWRLVDSYPRLSRTRDLAMSRPGPGSRELAGAAGRVAPLPAQACSYAGHCQQVVAECHRERPVLEPLDGREVACLRGGLRVMLRATGLSAGYRRVPIVSGVDLQVRAGETLAVAGPSGSGKTTLARCLAGLLAPLSGTIWSEDGGPRTGGRGSRIQLVAQDPVDALDPRFTVERLVAEPLVIARAESAQIGARVAAALTAVGLPADRSFLEHRPHQLSGGQLQRVAIARALVAEPLVLVADEPTAMLDPVEQARLLRVLRDLQDTTGLALVFITHNLPLVRKIAHRVIVVDRGEIVEAGAAHTVLSAPRHPTTRALLDLPATTQEDQ